MIILENDYLKATFSSKGAELQKLQNKTNGLNYLWKGDPAYWGKHSPILFPIVGALRDGAYQYKGKTYSLPRHGFARDLEFLREQPDPTSLRFTLTDTTETLKVYPFAFRLHVNYQLSGFGLSCTYEVENPGSSEILFSIGGHPAFTVPLDSELKYTDYYLEFNKDSELQYHAVDGDLVAAAVNYLQLDSQKLRLKHELFYQDALVLKTLKSDRVSIRSDKDTAALHFTFEGFPFFGIWAAMDAPFVCLEPWCGVADSEGHNQQLSEKEGIISLASGQKWQRTWKIEIQ